MFTSDHGVTAELRRGGQRRLGRSTRAARPTRAPSATRRVLPEAAASTRRSRHCDIHHNNMATPGRWATPSHFVHNNDLRQHRRLVDRLVLRRRPPGLPAGLDGVREQQHLLEQLQRLRARARDVKSITPVPIGVGILIAGGNDDIVRRQLHLRQLAPRDDADRRARRDRLRAAPEAGLAAVHAQGRGTTSNGNRYTTTSWAARPTASAMPNGVDFWWDEFPSNTGNCWYPNNGSDGHGGEHHVGSRAAAGRGHDRPRLPAAGLRVAGQRRARQPGQGGDAARLRRQRQRRRLRVVPAAGQARARPRPSSSRPSSRRPPSRWSGRPRPSRGASCSARCGTLTCQPPMPAGPSPAATAPTL